MEGALSTFLTPFLGSAALVLKATETKAEFVQMKNQRAM